MEPAEILATTHILDHKGILDLIYLNKFFICQHQLRGVDATEGRGYRMDEVDHGFTTTKAKVTMKNERGMVLAMV